MAKASNTQPVPTPASTISFYLKESAAPTKKPTKAKIEAVKFELELARVRRPDFEDAVFSGRIHALERIPAHVLKNPALRRRDYSGPKDRYILTLSDLGRSTTSPETQQMSFYSWVLKYFVPVIFNRDEVGVAVDK